MYTGNYQNINQIYYNNIVINIPSKEKSDFKSNYEKSEKDNTNTFDQRKRRGSIYESEK